MVSTSWAMTVFDAADADIADLHTVRFIERVQTLIDHPLDVARARLVGSTRSEEGS